jgi:penicillin-insensitive murein endopeptidase
MQKFPGRTLASAALAALVLGVGLTATPVVAQTPAKQLFGGASKPADLAARSIGSYARGCLAGGRQLDPDGPDWQAMRLSRNRNWGHPALIAYLERLARDAKRAGDWPGLLVGDLAQPRGGPMLTGHASHQIGLDADIWLTPMPDRRLSKRQREKISAKSVLKDGTLEIDARVWTERHARILKRAASYPEVARIFVHPAIKNQLCNWPGAGKGAERAWLRRIRPWYGHHYHFHVRLTCPAGMSGCKNQDPPPAGDGCGKALAWWLGPEPWAPRKPSKKPPKKKPEMKLSDLPRACKAVLEAPAPDGTRLAAVRSGLPADIPLPPARPATD